MKHRKEGIGVDGKLMVFYKDAVYISCISCKAHLHLVNKDPNLSSICKNEMRMYESSYDQIGIGIQTVE